MAGRLQGKVALVTGSGQSVGAVVALMMAREGARVMVNSRTEVSQDDTPTAADTLAQLRAEGLEAEAIFADVATMEGCRRLVDGCREAFGGLDILINHAGHGPVHTIGEMTEEQWDRVLSVNLKSQYMCSHLALPLMRAKGWGRIINYSSRGGLHGVPAMSAYAAAKSGSLGFTYALARELQDEGITVNAIIPRANTLRMAATRAAMAASTGQAMFEDSPSLSPENAAPMTVYLATDSAAQITGQAFFTAAGVIALYHGPAPGQALTKDGRWTLDELEQSVPAAFGQAMPPPPFPPQPE